MKIDPREDEAALARSSVEDREWDRYRKEAAEIIRRILAERKRLHDLCRRIKERRRAGGAPKGLRGLERLLVLVEETWPNSP